MPRSKKEEARFKKEVEQWIGKKTEHVYAFMSGVLPENWNDRKKEIAVKRLGALVRLARKRQKIAQIKEDEESDSPFEIEDVSSNSEPEVEEFEAQGVTWKIGKPNPGPNV